MDVLRDKNNGNECTQADLNVVRRRIKQVLSILSLYRKLRQLTMNQSTEGLFNQ